MHRRYYDILGVSQDADDKAIKKAFRKLAQQYHPDRNQGNAEAEGKFKEVNRAYEVLGDPEKRKLYDEFGEDAEKLGFDADKARTYRQWRAGGGAGFDASGVDLEELLSQIFGGAAGARGPFGGGGDPFGGGDFGGPFRGQGRAQRGPRPGHDLRAELTLDFTTACLGGERTLTLDGRPVTVRIPAGVSDGGTLRLRGQGAPGPGGGPSGDLLLELRVAPDPHFEREGDHLRLDVPITLGEALRGATIEVPTLDGAVRVKVPAGAQPGTVLRVRGKGVHRRSRPPGDLLVSLRVRLPPVEGASVDEAIAALESLYDEDVRKELRRRLATAAA